MTGAEYANTIARYVFKNFGDRGLRVYREVGVGKTIIGKSRRIDILVLNDASNEALALECKYQDSPGTVDEKIPYALDDMRAMRMPGYIVYAGVGFSPGVIHLLQSSEMAAYCLPDPDRLERTNNTRELDHVLAQTFHWWDILTENKNPVGL